MTSPLDQRTIPRLGRDVSVVGLGCWQLGADWGDVSEDGALEILRAAADSGVTVFDTADVYGDGRSEKLIARFRAETGDRSFVATKIGRRADPFLPETYTERNLRDWVDRSRVNLAMDRLDLVQLHCPPEQIYSDDRVYDVLDALVREEKIAAYGVSVETCDQALTAMARPGVATVQIILNLFRRKPLDQVLPAAQAAGVGVIARVPLASGMLSGKYSASTSFAENDHRNYNRAGAAFDVGETFSGVDYETGLAAVDELRAALPGGWPLPQAALAWIIGLPGVSTVIPGARTPEQARRNADAGRSGSPGPDFEAAARRVYDTHLREAIHPRW